MLRGVWGAALRSLDRVSYERVFQGGEGGRKAPLYLVRPATPDPGDAPALDWFLFGEAASSPEPALLEAWRHACAAGLGPERRRFAIRRIRTYGPDGRLLEGNGSGRREWSLASAAWPLEPGSPCRVSFPAPLRILRRGALIIRPTIVDLVVAALRRVEALLADAGRGAVDELRADVLNVARRLRADSWNGNRLDLHRWSGRQNRELELRGVAGHLELPEGPGVLAPLLAAAQWTHVGKGSTVGLGQLNVESAC